MISQQQLGVQVEVRVGGGAAAGGGGETATGIERGGRKKETIEATFTQHVLGTSRYLHSLIDHQWVTW